MASTGAVCHRLRAGLRNAVKTPQKNRRKQYRLPTGLRCSGVSNRTSGPSRQALPSGLGYCGVIL